MDKGGEVSPPIYRNCEFCGKEFKVVLFHDYVIYCSSKCVNDALNYENGETCKSNQNQMKSSG